MKKRGGTTLFIVALLALMMGNPPCAFSRGPSIRDQIRKRIAKRNILAFPSIASQVVAFKRKKLVLRSASAVSPALITIPFITVKDLFWRDLDGLNVVDALNSSHFTAPYCGEFFAGTQDGSSGGLGACHMAESVGFSYKTIVQGGISFCYMQNFPTKRNQSAHGISVVSGKLPAGGITQLFAVPSGNRPRTVKVNLLQGNDSPGQLYFRINSAAANRTERNIFGASLWLCNEGEVQGYDIITLSNSLRFTVHHGDTSPKTTFIDGILTLANDALTWDSAKTRSGSTVLADENGNGFKSEFEITKENLITLRRVDAFEGRQGRGIFVTKFSGSTIEDIRFPSGSYKEIYQNRSLLGAVDFNGRYYAVNSQSSLLPKVSNQDLYSGYFNSPLIANVDTTPYSCSTTPDIEISLDLDNAAVHQSLRRCDKAFDDLENMHFCLDDAQVSEAEENAGNYCQ